MAPFDAASSTHGCHDGCRCSYSQTLSLGRVVVFQLDGSIVAACFHNLNPVIVALVAWPLSFMHCRGACMKFDACVPGYSHGHGPVRDLAVSFGQS